MSVMQTLDVEKIRKDFPILNREIRGKKLVYLDNAATSQKPLAVIEAQARVYTQMNANVHRGVHLLSQESTDAYEKSRRKIANFLGTKDEGEIIFTRGTTEALNLVAQSWGRANVQSGDEVVVTRMEHHSNFVPWQVLAKEKGATFTVCELTPDYTLDLEMLKRILARGKTKVLAVTAMSNVLGTVTPIREIAAMAKKAGALVVVDGAQAMAHLPVRLKDFGEIDFLAFSAHKMCGPTGIGVLWGKRAILEKMPPYQFGGDMILQVGDEATSWNELPWKFEAGTPNYGDSIAFGAALDYLEAIGRDRIHTYELALVRYAQEKISGIKGLKIQAPKDPTIHGGVLSFTVEGVHPHDLGTFLDAEGVAIRAGHHCAQPLMRKLSIPATNRASFYFYNTLEEIDVFADALVKAVKFFA